MESERDWGWRLALIAGRVLGVTDNGALRLLVDGNERDFYGGEISMKAPSIH